MARTYIPREVRQVHELAKYMARYNAILRAAVIAIDPSAESAYDALYAAVIAFDTLSQTLYPLQP